MKSFPQMSREAHVKKLFSDGYTQHGDLGLGADKFAAQIFLIVEKYLGTEVPCATEIRFINSLRTNDLYLSIACAQRSASAWDRFASIYQKYIYDLAVFASASKDMARELADSVLADMFLPDRSGNSRIASYSGRSSLATWLRVIVSHRATNDRELKFNTIESFGSEIEWVDSRAFDYIEAAFRANRYGYLIKDSFEYACKNLTNREKLILLLRYEDELQLGDIARLLVVHQSTVTRQLERIQEKLRNQIISLLANKYCLSQAAITECLADIVENPSHSIITLLHYH